MLVESEGGVGKTALLRRFTGDVAPRPPVWVSGDDAELDLLSRTRTFVRGRHTERPLTFRAQPLSWWVAMPVGGW